MASSVSVVDERIEISVTNRKNASTSPAIAPIWPSKWNELLAAKAHAAVTTISSGNVDSCFINEFHEM